VDIVARLVRIRGTPQTVSEDQISKAPAMYYELELDRGMSFPTAQRELAFRKSLDDPSIQSRSKNPNYTGFMQSKRPAPGGRHFIHMFCRVPKSDWVSLSAWVPLYRDYMPNRGLSQKLLSEFDLKERYVNISDADAQQLWETTFGDTLKGCYHGPSCDMLRRNRSCLTGNRVSLQPFLAGCIMPLWSVLADCTKTVTVNHAQQRAPLKICRVRINDGDHKGKRLVGIKLEGRNWQGKFKEQGFKIEVTETTNLGQPKSNTFVLNREETHSPERIRQTVRRQARRVVIDDDDDDDEYLNVVPDNSQLQGNTQEHQGARDAAQPQRQDVFSYGQRFQTRATRSRKANDPDYDDVTVV